MAAFKYSRVNLYYSEEEWKDIEAIISSSGHNDLIDFLGKSLKDVVARISQCPTCSEEVVVRRAKHVQIPPYVDKMLSDLSKRYGMPPAAVINKFIVFPALDALSKKKN